MGSRGYDAVMGLLLRSTTRGHRLLHRVTRGRWGRTLVGAPIVWLTLPGRRTGEPRTVPLLVSRDLGHDPVAWVVCGSNAGQTAVPAWVHNARAAGCGVVLDGGTRVPVWVVEVLDPDEHDRLYAGMVEVWRGFRAYRVAAGRHVPLFRLVPMTP